MPIGPLPSCACIGGFKPEEVQQWILCALLSINTAVGGDTGSDQYTSTVENASADGSIPAGQLGWSITALSGTVTVNGEALPVGASVSGGGYNTLVTSSAITYTVTAGTALIVYDTPA